MAAQDLVRTLDKPPAAAMMSLLVAGRTTNKKGDGTLAWLREQAA